MRCTIYTVEDVDRAHRLAKAGVIPEGEWGARGVEEGACQGKDHTNLASRDAVWVFSVSVYAGVYSGRMPYGLIVE